MGDTEAVALDGIPPRGPALKARLRSARLLGPPFGLTLVCALASVPASAAARQGARESVVLLAPQDRPALTEQLVRALWAQLSDVSVDLRVERVQALAPDLASQLQQAQASVRPATLAVLWVEEAAGMLRILLPSDGGGRLVSRNVGAAGDAGRYEATGVILRNSVLARRSGREVGEPLPPSRPLLPPAATRPAHSPACPSARPCPATPPRRPSRVALELAWAADVYAPQALLASGLRVAVDVRLHRSWRVFAGYRLEAPIEANGVAAGLELRRHPVDLGARFWWRSGRVRLGGRLAVGLAVVEPRVPWYGPGLRPEEAGRAVVYTITPQISAAFQAARRLWLLLDLGAAVQLGNLRYTAEPSGEVLAAPLVVQPTLLLGLQVDVL